MVHPTAVPEAPLPPPPLPPPPLPPLAPPPSATPAARARRPMLAPVALGAAALAGCVAAALVDPERSVPVTVCPFRAMTGWDCPGCGATRALHDLAGGRVVAAAEHNLLLVLAVPLVVLAYLQWTRRRLGRDAAPVLAGREWAVWPALGVLMLFWAIRNIDHPSVAWLASAAG